MVSQGLRPASELADHGNRFPNESDEYRKARTALLAEEIDLRRHIERVAAQRRALPPGGKVPEDYQFIGESGRVRLSDLFGEHDTLVTYNFMFGPKRDRPCPMCTSLLECLGWRDPRHGAARCHRSNREVADRAPARVQEGARMAPLEALFIGRKRLQP